MNKGIIQYKCSLPILKKYIFRNILLKLISKKLILKKNVILLFIYFMYLYWYYFASSSCLTSTQRTIFVYGALVPVLNAADVEL